MKTNAFFAYILVFFSVALVSCEDEEILKQIPPPPPQVEFTFTDAQGNPTRASAPNFTITNPGLEGSFTFNVRVNPNDSRLVDSVFIEYQYGLLTSGGGAATFGWAEWDALDVSPSEPVFEFPYTFSIAELNEFYAGAPIIASGRLGSTVIARDENETRITVKFTDGSTARSPKLTWTYPITPAFSE